MTHHHHHATTRNTCYCTCSHQSPPLPPPPQQPPLLSSTDPLLQVLASQILLQQQQQQSSQLNNSTTSNQHQNHTTSQFQHHNRHQHQQQQHQQEEENDQTKKIISSLLTRIDALESSLYRLSASPSSSPSRFKNRYSSIRDVAARTIQAYFREFLVRRSRTLRNLKDLAVIKSAFISLKSLVSGQNYFDHEIVSREAMDLLFELDSIQGGDPMIRDGKRAISRDLVRFLDFIDGVSVKRRLELSTRAVKNLRSVENRNKSMALGIKSKCVGGKDQREIIEKIRKKIQNVSVYDKVLRDDKEEVELEGFHHGSDDEQIARVLKLGKNEISQIRNGIVPNRNGGQSRVMKCVSFAENGNKIMAFINKNDTSSDDSGGHDEQLDHINSPDRMKEDNGSFSKEAEDDEELHTESGQSDQTSDSEENPARKISGSEYNYESRQGQNGRLIILAPVPVKMESRADMGRRERLRKFEVDG